MKGNEFYNTIGLAYRAGKLVHGEEGVMQAVRSRKAKLVIVAEDAAANTVKKFSDKCNYYRIPFVRYGLREKIGSSLGKDQRAVLAVMDEGFVRLVRSKIENF